MQDLSKSVENKKFLNNFYKYDIISAVKNKGKKDMKYKQFDVVLLENKNKATILGIENMEYNAEIVDQNGNRIEIKKITDDEIDKILFRK